MGAETLASIAAAASANPGTTALLATQVAATGASVAQGVEARREEKRAAKAQTQMARAKTRRDQLQQLARLRAFRASTINAAEQTGVGDTSTTTGTVASVASSAADNIGYLSSNLRGSIFIQQRQQAANENLGNVDLANSVNKVAGTVAEITGAYDELFKTKKDGE